MAMQSLFDKVDFPPSIEARTVPLPWLKNWDSSANIPDKDLTVSDIPDSKRQPVSTGSSSIPTDSSLKEKVQENEEAVMQKLQQSKKFDNVDYFLYHPLSAWAS